MLGVAGVDALPVLHQPAKHRRAENHRDGVRYLPHPSLSRHQIRVGRLARLGGHPVHHPLQGQSAHYNHAPHTHTHKRRLDTALFIFLSSSSSIPSSVSFLVFYFFVSLRFTSHPLYLSVNTHLRAHTHNLLQYFQPNHSKHSPHDCKPSRFDPNQYRQQYSVKPIISVTHMFSLNLT